MSQYICADAEHCFTRTVVEWNAQGVVEALILLDDMRHETAGTLFYDGIISGRLLEPDLQPDMQKNAFEFIAAHTQPIRVGEPNQLLLWTNVDFAARRLTQDTEIIVLA